MLSSKKNLHGVHRFSNFPAVNSRGKIKISLDIVGLEPANKGFADKHLNKCTLQIIPDSLQSLAVLRVPR